jgi:hypothetical protein
MNYYTAQILTREGFEEEYLEAETAAEAIAQVRAMFGYDLVSVAIRKQLYKEWRCNLTVAGVCHVTHGGKHAPLTA